MIFRALLAPVLTTLHNLDLASRLDFLENAAIETGGFWKPVEVNNTWDNQRLEFRAYGIFASDETETAIRAWIHIARQQAKEFSRVDRAMRILLSEKPETATDMLGACETILDDGQLPDAVKFARQIKHGLDRSAA